jgi:hypothetical protein
LAWRDLIVVWKNAGDFTPSNAGFRVISAIDPTPARNRNHFYLIIELLSYSLAHGIAFTGYKQSGNDEQQPNAALFNESPRQWPGLFPIAASLPPVTQLKRFGISEQRITGMRLISL